MDPHSSWYIFFPLYNKIYEYLSHNYSYTVIFNGGILPKIKVINTIHHVYAALLVSLFLVIMSTIFKMRVKRVDQYVIPSYNVSLVNIIEIFYETLSGVMIGVLGNNYRKHINFVGTLALFIFCSNSLGLVPGFPSSTDNLNVTLACGIAVFIYFNYYGIKTHGFDHITHLANPMGIWWGWFLSPLFFPIELMGLIIRPFSLGIRLAGNMIGDHSIVVAFTSITPLLLPLPFFFFGFVVCVIQTFVFCLLTCIYISIHTADNH